MRLLSIIDIDTHDLDEQVFRTSSTGSLIMFIICLAIVVGVSVPFLWSYFKGEVSGWFSIGVFWIVFWVGIIAWVAWARFRSSLLASNWLVRVSPERILVKFRSFQNYCYPETDLVVIELPWREIDWVRKTKETTHKDQGDNAVTEFFTYLDIKLHLSERELKEIDRGLQEERKRKPLRSSIDELNSELLHARKNKAPKYEIDAIKDKIRQEKAVRSRDSSKSSAKYHDYPVRLMHENMLRIRWNSIKPGIKKALVLFGERTTIDDEIKIVTDSSKDDLSGKELEDMILDRIARGDKFDARALVKKHYGYSTTEAVKFVDDLMNNQSTDN